MTVIARSWAIKNIFFFKILLCHLSQIDTFLHIFLSETVVASNKIDSIKISVCVGVYAAHPSCGGRDK